MDRHITCIQMDHVTRVQAYPSILDKMGVTIGMVLTIAWADDMYPDICTNIVKDPPLNIH